MNADDRTVHALLHTLEIVRYDRAGAWYSEIVDGRRYGRRRITLAEAAQSALACEASGGAVFLGRPGGARFDLAVARLRAGGGGA